MLDLFNTTLRSRLEGKSSRPFLLAISGGMDSMVMLHMLKSTHWPIVVAHVDHNSRGGQSTLDAQFVKDYCQSNNIIFHSTKINKGNLKGNNFQSEAREFRYRYFRKLASELSLDYMLTAHHKDDRWENVIHALSRSAGLNGLSSLRYEDGDLIRPLMIFTRNQLEEYAEQHNVPFVHDQSNDTNDYTRNKIRHLITPAAKKVFPKIVEGAAQSADFLNEEKKLLEEFLERGQFIDHSKKYVSIDRDLVCSYSSKQVLMARLVYPFDFTRSDAIDMLSARTGAVFFNDSFEALADRNMILIREKVGKGISNVSFSITGLGTFDFDSIQVKVSLADDRSVKHLILDENKLRFPLELRKWTAGDKMQPAGMGGKSKKVKDILTDMKLSKWEKEETVVLISDTKIIQIVGHRTAESYRSERGLVIDITV